MSFLQTLQGWFSGTVPYEKRGYEGASQTRRMRNFRPATEDLNSLLSAEGDELRARCRHMFRSNGWAANARDSFASNTIGTGIKPQSRHPSEAVREQLQKWWLEWTDYCDTAGITDLYGLQKMIVDAQFEAGECFVRLRVRRSTDDFPIPLQLQLLEAEHCPLTMNQTGSDVQNLIRCGIEFNRLGQRVAYHLFREHPGSDAPRIIADNIVAVPADKVLHQYRPRRPGQVRGEPWLAPALVPLYELDQYQDAELVRKKTVAMITHFIRVASTLDVPKIGTDGTEPDLPEVTNVVPGSTIYLKEGEEVQASQAADVGPNYTEFIQSCLYQIAAGMGITYEMISGDRPSVNYSSIRAGQLEVRRRIEQFQHQVLVYQFCRPVWEAFLEGCVMGGKLDAKEYNQNKAQYLDVEWRTPAWAWVDPVKDVQAKILEINNHLTSRDAVIHERGEDPEEVDASIDEGIKRSDYEPGAVPPPAPGAQQGGFPPAKKKPAVAAEVVQ